jgi:hypothetical protein
MPVKQVVDKKYTIYCSEKIQQPNAIEYKDGDSMKPSNKRHQDAAL